MIFYSMTSRICVFIHIYVFIYSFKYFLGWMYKEIQYKTTNYSCSVSFLRRHQPPPHQ